MRFQQIVLSCTTNWKEIWGRTYQRDSPVTYDKILSGDNDGYLLAGVESNEENILIQEINEFGEFRNAMTIDMTPNSLAHEKEENNAHSVNIVLPLPPCLALSDNGVLVIGVKGIPQMNAGLVISRIAPDLTACNATSEQVAPKTGNTAVQSNSQIWLESEPTHIDIQEIDIVPAKITVTTHDLSHRTTEFQLEPYFVCQESMTASAVAAPDVTSENILLSPNSLQVGQRSELTFTLPGKETPEISILTVATGQVVRQVAENAVQWSYAEGTGSVGLETDGMAAGVYLVRVRSGERQLTAKLEIR